MGRACRTHGKKGYVYIYIYIYIYIYDACGKARRKETTTKT
jgi:hypothetical protein